MDRLLLSLLLLLLMLPGLNSFGQNHLNHDSTKFLLWAWLLLVAVGNLHDGDLLAVGWGEGP